MDASKKTDDYLVLSVDGTNVPPPFVLVREELWLSVIGTAPFLAWARSHTSRPGDPEPGTTVHQWPHSITVPQVFSPGYDATVIVLARRPGGELLNLVIELPASMLTLIPAPEKKQLKSTTAKGALFDLYAAKVAAFDELLLDLTEELDALPEAERAELYGVLNATALGQ
ncbi:MAG: hypothetical protein AMXMBFR64_08220 [Myxococcales bacterium]